MGKIVLGNRQLIKKFENDEDYLGAIYLAIEQDDLTIDIENIPNEATTLYVVFNSTFMFNLWKYYENIKHLKIYLIDNIDAILYIKDYKHNLSTLNLDIFKDSKPKPYNCIYVYGNTKEANKILNFLKEYSYNVSSLENKSQHIDNNDIIINCTNERIDSKQVYSFLIFGEKIRDLIVKLSKQHISLDINSFIDYLLSNIEVVRYNPYAAIAYIYQNSIIRKSTKKKIAFCPHSCAYRNNLLTQKVYTYLQDNYDTYFLYGEKCNDKFENLPNSYYVGKGLIGYFENLDLLIYPALSLVLPKKVKKLYMLHDIYDSPLGKAEAPRKCKKTGELKVSRYLELLDYAFLPSKSVMQRGRLQDNIQKDVCYIPGGYFKLDGNIKKFNKYSNCTVDSIIYAPTVIDDVLRKHHSQPKYGIKIIKALLDNFKDYKIIFRPHPHSIDDPCTIELVNNFKDNNRFVFDNNPSEYMKNYARSKLMVSDISGTAYTYAFTTNRPVIFFSVDEENVEKDMGGVAYFRDRSKIGSIVEDIDTLVRTVQSYLSDYNNIINNVLDFRKEAVFNVGNSEEYFLNSLKYIIEDIKHPDWTYLK